MRNPEERQLIENVLTRGMRREREKRGKTLEDVCKAAADVGITWDTSTLSRIEMNKRQIWLYEFVAMPLIMTMACGEPVTLGDLLNLDDFDGDEIVAVARLAPMLAESQRAVWPGEDWGQLREFVTGDLEVAVREVQASRVPDEGASSLQELEGFADRLGVPTGAVMGAIWDLANAGDWTYRQPRLEREHRLVERGEDLSQGGRIKVLRSHITRKMEREIAAKLEEQRHGVDHEGEERVAGTLEDTGRR